MGRPDDRNEGDYLLRREGDYWMAEAPCYKDPEMNPVGYGKTQQEAVDELIRQPQFQELLERRGDRPPALSHFTIETPTADEESGDKWRVAAGALDYYLFRLVGLF
jgi:hypothetical protein